MPPNIKHWTNFLKVAQTGSLSRVADGLGIAQPVLSRQIRALEEEFDTVLFERTGRGMRLTVAGEQFRERASNILDQIALIRGELNTSADQPSGSLSLGLPPTMTTMLAGPLIFAYASRHPHVQLRVHEMALAALRPAILRAEVELGIGVLPLSDPELNIEPLLEESLYIIGKPSARFEGGTLSPHQIAQMPLVLPRHPNGFRLILETVLGRKGLTPTVVMEAGFGSTIECVAQGLGYGVVPGCALRNATMGRRISTSRIRGTKVLWGTVHLKKHRLSSAAIGMKREIINTCRDLVSSKRWRATMLAAL